MGELPDWSPVRVDISTDSLMFYFVKYDDKDFCEQIGFLEMKCPPHLSVCVEILESPDDDLFPQPDGNS